MGFFKRFKFSKTGLVAPLPIQTQKNPLNTVKKTRKKDDRILRGRNLQYLMVSGK